MAGRGVALAGTALLFAVLVAAYALRWSDAEPGTTALGAAAGLAVVVAAAVGIPWRARRLAAHPPAGALWAGPAGAAIDDLRRVANVDGAAPRPGPLSEFLFASGTVGGRLTLTPDAVSFRPDAVGRWRGAGAWTLPVAEVLGAGLHGRELVLRPRKGPVMRFQVTSTVRLPEALAALPARDIV